MRTLKIKTIFHKDDFKVDYKLTLDENEKTVTDVYKDIDKIEFDKHILEYVKQNIGIDFPDCCECENKTIQDYADILGKYEELKNYKDIIEKGYDNAQIQIKMLRDKVDMLENKLKIYEGK